MATAPTFTSTDVRDFLTANPQLTDADIADLMDAYGVSKATVQEATGIPLSEVEARYAAAASPERTSVAQDFINQIDTASGYTRPTTTLPVNKYSNVEQGFIDWLSSNDSWSDKDIANYIAANGVPLEFVSNYTGLPYSQVLSRYTAASQTTAPGQIPTVPGVTLGAGFAKPEYTQRDFSLARATPEVVVPATYADRALLGGGAPGASAGVFGLPGALMPIAYPGVPAAAARPAENVAPAEGEGMKRGGIASLASKGRYGDTMLAHISPEEARMLMAMGGAGTINPQTGLPEFWNPLKQIRDAVENVGKGIGKVLKPVAKVAPFILPFIPGFNVLAPMYQGLIAGGIGSLQDGKFNFKRGLMSGLTTYGLASLGQGLQNAGTGANAGATATPPLGGETMSLDQLAASDASRAMMGADDLATANAARSFANQAAPTAATGSVWDQGVQKLQDQAAGIKNAFTDPKAAAEAIGKEFGTGTAAATMTGASGIAAIDEAEKLQREQDAVVAAAEEKKRRQREFAESILSRYPIRFAAEGGMMYDDNPGYDGMKAGGLREGSFVIPADVVAHLGNGSTDAGLAALSKKYAAQPIKGRGDGMSDSIPTNIEGRQKARVANGEAVIPPEVVKKVQPKRLYAMMDNVRKARTGTTKQGKQINPAQYMPA